MYYHQREHDCFYTAVVGIVAGFGGGSNLSYTTLAITWVSRAAMNKLPVAKIIYGAFVLPWSGFGVYSRALAMPMLVLVSTWAVWLYVDPSGYLYDLVFSLLYLAAFSFFAITCHRLILVGGVDPKKLNAFNFGRFLRFYGWMLLIVILCVVLSVLIINIYVNAFAKPELTEIAEEAISSQVAVMDEGVTTGKYLAYLPVMYVFGRLSLVFPATAIGLKSNLKWSWRATRNNGIRVLVIVGVFPWVMEALLSMAERDNATAVEQAVIGLLLLLCWAIGIFALSLTYLELRSYER